MLKNILNFCFALAILLCPAWGNSSHAASPPHRKVLLFNSYHRGNPWGDATEQGIRERLSASDFDIEMSVEYLDTRRFEGSAQLDSVATYLVAKFRDYPVDLIFVADNAAFDFMASRRSWLFPHVPIVFCGYNDFQPENLQGMSNITGVNEGIDIEAGIGTALEVHPGTQTLAFILSTDNVSDRRFSAMAESRVFPGLRKRFEVVVLKDASLSEIRARLEGLSPDSLVFLGGLTRDMAEGRHLTHVETARVISHMAPVPIYAFWDFQLGTGVLGGRILTGWSQGREAAEIGLRILAGASADSIPVQMNPPTEKVFDYEVMQRFGLDMDSLPSGSRVINRPEDAWTRYRREILGVLGLIALETLLIVALVHAMRQRKRALKALENERALLETRVMERTEELRAKSGELEEALLTRNLLLDNALVIIALVRDRRFVWVSNHVSEVIGYEPEECIGRSTVFVYYYPEDYQRLWREALSILKEGGTYQGDYCFRRKDGTPLWGTLSARALDPEDLEKGILFVVVDINSRKLMEDALRDAKAHLEVLSTTDQLTGLANRRKLTDVLGDEMNRAKRYNQPFSVIMIDLDHFKKVNDTFGHDVGDYVLKTVAKILTGNLRVTDIAGRWGGEEFMIICPTTALESAMVLAELVRMRIEHHDYAMPGRITASMGVVAYSAGIDVETLVKLADEALYEAKAAGRNCIRAAGAAG